jgi:cytochrome c biogenesis protein CcmG/thiol:disulfide interchange protein DsbE
MSTDPNAKSSDGMPHAAAEPNQSDLQSRRWSAGWPTRRIAALASATAVFAVVAIWQAASASHSTGSDPLVGRTGQTAPPFSIPNLAMSSHTIAPADFRGRDLVINFWASWCIPCRTEMPLLEHAHRAAGGQVQFLGIDSNDTSSAAVTFLNQVHVTYPVASDDGGSVATAYGLFGLPTTVFVSPNGKVVGRIIGQLHSDTLRNAIKEAFHVQLHA